MAISSKAKEADMEKLTQALMTTPLFAFIVAAIEMAKLASKGTDIRPIVSALVDEVVPAIA